MNNYKYILIQTHTHTYILNMKNIAEDINKFAITQYWFTILNLYVK